MGSYRSWGFGGDVETLCGQPAPPGGAPLLPGVLDDGAEAGQHALVAEQPRVAGRHRARIDRGVRVAEEDRVVARPRASSATLVKRASRGVPLRTERFLCW